MCAATPSATDVLLRDAVIAALGEYRSPDVLPRRGACLPTSFFGSPGGDITRVLGLSPAGRLLGGEEDRRTDIVKLGPRGKAPGKGGEEDRRGRACAFQCEELYCPRALVLVSSLRHLVSAALRPLPSAIALAYLRLRQGLHDRGSACRSRTPSHTPSAVSQLLLPSAGSWRRREGGRLWPVSEQAKRRKRKK